MSLLNELKNCLEKIDPHVCYGKCSDDYVLENGWNVIVFNRRSIRKLSKDIIKTFEISICRESSIDEDLAMKIIKAVTGETKLKFPEQDMPYSYIKKGESDDVVEILTLTFTKQEKNVFC